MSIDYWVQVGANLDARPPEGWWREYCDGLNREWLHQALPDRAFRRALKTDLFDEALGGGIELPMADRLVGIDLAKSTARLARQRRGMKGAAADVRQLPFFDGAFDLVVSLSTLDHFAKKEEITQALHEMRRVLAPGGVLAMTLDNRSNPWIRLRSYLPWSVLSRWSVVPYFTGVTLTRRELLEALAESGFRVLQSTAIMHSPRLLIVPLARRVGGARLMRAVGGLEMFGRLRTRYRTGLYLAVVAEATSTPEV